MSAGEAAGVSAGEAVQAAAVAALGELGLKVFDADPVRAAVPFAVVEDPVLGDWSTKSWTGREGRLLLVIQDEGERPVRLRRLAGAAEARLQELVVSEDGWRLVAMRLVRSRVARTGRERWAATVEWRVRLWREQGEA